MTTTATSGTAAASSSRGASTSTAVTTFNGGANRLQPPPDSVYNTFEDLLSSVQKVAKDQGYSIVKLRASNYRDNKPTRYDLVCDRGGVKYISSAKKRTPNTRKIDCPWRAKAVCEVQLGMHWRFQVQEPRHNHDPRVTIAPPGSVDVTPVAQTLKSTSHKIDRLGADLKDLMRQCLYRLEHVEKRLESIESRMAAGEQQQRFEGSVEHRLAMLEQGQHRAAAHAAAAAAAGMVDLAPLEVGVDDDDGLAASIQAAAASRGDPNKHDYGPMTLN